MLVTTERSGGRAVLWRVEDDVGTITLDLPASGNAIGHEGAVELADAIDQVTSRPVRAVLLTARGDRFCAGGDIAEFVARPDDLEPLIAAIVDRLHPAIHRLAQVPVPVISAVNGPLGGAGIALALCADIVLASDAMKLRGGYTAIGLSPDLGASYYLTRRVGAARAKRILLMNETLTAARCLELGIVDEVVPAKELPAAARRLVHVLSQGATQSFAGVKMLCDTAGAHSLQEHLALEREQLIAATRTRDAHEGLRAFMEKRPPTFVGS